MPESFYAFPIGDLVVDPTTTKNHVALLEVNVDRSFRWEDESFLGFKPNVFDTTPVSYEPVKAFGANAFTLTVAPE